MNTLQIDEILSLKLLRTTRIEYPCTSLWNQDEHEQLYKFHGNMIDRYLTNYTVWNEKFKTVVHQHIQYVMNNFGSRVAWMLKKKDEEIANANTTVMTLKNHVFKLETEKCLWKKVAKTPEQLLGYSKETLNR
ncbi:hypothetical protein QJS10_CPA05g01600 [Acorus calamus]|uniref:Uncharacterized protein n=1 Tax=Acorus calamus TaxID=4465 RepID=A0AAV9EYZ7_ACOCL|nr:hypothetical protein QJS10_CPA05g01600 [Acorus calamus]